MKVMAMFDKAEKEYNDLIKKKQIVEEDKSKVPHILVSIHASFPCFKILQKVALM